MGLKRSRVAPNNSDCGQAGKNAVQSDVPDSSQVKKPRPTIIVNQKRDENLLLTSQDVKPKYSSSPNLQASILVAATDNTSLYAPFKGHYNRSILVSGFTVGLKQQAKDDLLAPYKQTKGYTSTSWISAAETVVVFDSEESAVEALTIPIHGLLRPILLHKYVLNNFSYYSGITSKSKN
jgi:hypothetical protein